MPIRQAAAEHPHRRSLLESRSNSLPSIMPGGGFLNVLIATGVIWKLPFSGALIDG